MHRARWIALGSAALALVLLSGPAAAQAPDTSAPPSLPAPSPPPATPPPEPVPLKPAPVAPAPGGPETPVPPPAAREEPEPSAPAQPTAEQQPVPEESPLTGLPAWFGPNVFTGPDLFNPPAQQGWLSITPTLTLSGEYNDNLSLEASGRNSDFNVGLIPGVNVSMQRPRYRLLAGYNVAGQFYAQESQLNNFGDEQRAFGDFSYQLAPTVQFTLADQFLKGRNSSDVTSTGQQGGRHNSWRNTLVSRLRWQATPLTGFGVFASHTAQRFSGGDGGSSRRDSDTFRLGASAEHRLTARLTGVLGFDGAHIDFEDAPAVRTYTLRSGLAYQITPTLRASVSAGPSLIDRDGDQKVRPSVTARVNQDFQFGTLRIGYARYVSAGIDSTSDQHSLFASLVVPTLVRGLRLALTPRYNIIDRDITGGSGDQTVLTVNVQAVYQIARSISLIGSYTYYRETDDQRADVDQNRVFLGIQYAFPINFY